MTQMILASHKYRNERLLYIYAESGHPAALCFFYAPVLTTTEVYHRSATHYPLKRHNISIIGFCTKKDGRKSSTTSYRICGNLPSEFLDFLNCESRSLSYDLNIHSKEFELPGSIRVCFLTTFFTSTRQSSGFAHLACRCNLTS